MNKMNILLIDTRVSRYEELVDAIDPNLAIGITFDYHADTFETIKARIIEALQLHGASAPASSSAAQDSVSVGLIQHNYNAPTFSMVASEHSASSTSSSCIVSQVETLDPNLETWTRFKDFIVWCKTECGAAHFDMMACALYSNPDWKYIIDTLAKPAPGQTGVDIRASTDDTGSAALGGDWFLESHSGVNLKDVYFTEQIDTYRGVFGAFAQNSFFITSTGAVYGTGYNDHGHLGLGDTTNRTVPTLISTNIGLLKIVAVSAGYYHSLFLTSTGRVYSAGWNGYGQLGLSDNTDRNVPTLTSLTNVVAISAGNAHSLFITSTGAVYGMGDNYDGQLGMVNGTTNLNVPTLISTNIGNLNIVAVSAGSGYSLFLTSTGAVYSTGYNANGQLGLGDNTKRYVPTLIPALANVIVIAVSAGSGHSLFLTNTGKVYGAGYNENGHLGLGNNTNQNSPMLIPSLTNVVAVSAGASYSLFLTSAGAVYSTGYNANGQLGLGDTTNRNVPTKINGDIQNLNIVAISGAFYHSFFITNTGAVYCTGWNGFGQLGLGDSLQRNVPTLISAHTLMSGTYQLADNSRAPAKFVSVGEGTTGGTSASIVYSYDGINWSPSIGVNSVFSNGYGVTYNSSLSRWVAVGSGTGTNKIAYSYDGIYWVGVSDSSSIFSDEGLGVST